MHIISKQGSADNVLTYEHICDTAADMAAIERRYITLGSVCIVLQGESGAMEVYMADSDKEWHDVIVTGGSGSGSEGGTAGLSLYICTSSEVANGKPNVDVPMEGVLYLVPSGNETGNLYNEYVYVNNDWEMFGSAGVDLTGYATIQAMNSAIENIETAIENNLPTKVSDLTNDSGFINPATQPTEDGTALVYVNGAWKAQPGYGYSTTEDSFVLKEFTSSDFSANENSNIYNGGYVATFTLTEETSAIAYRMFFEREEFNIRIGNAIYNSIADNFIYTTSPYGMIYLEDNNSNKIFALVANTVSNMSFYIPEISNNVKIYGTITTYTPFSKYLLPNSNIKNGTGSGAVILNSDTNIANREYAVAEGYDTSALGHSSHAEGLQTIALGQSSHAEGWQTVALGQNSHAEGSSVYKEINISSTAEIYKYQVSGTIGGRTNKILILNNGTEALITEYDSSNNIITVSIDLGTLNNEPVKIYSGIAYGQESHVEGDSTIAYGQSSHSEGLYTLAYGNYSHAEGEVTTASGTNSHAEGYETTASGSYSHAEGNKTIAASNNQHVQGRNNVSDNQDVYADIVGNGTSNGRSNAYALTWTGDGHYAGDVYVHSNSDSTGGNKLATEAYVTNVLSASTETVSGATPTVTAVANKTYICGTVSTLSFTPASSGISDILFTSGSTATVLTVPNTVKFPEWFDPSNLSANTTYEISVMNGTYGAVMAWATI